MSANLEPCVPPSSAEDAPPLEGVGGGSSSSSSTRVTAEVEGEDHHRVKESGVDGNVDDEEDGYHTPTSPRNRIPAAVECPPAPKKPRIRPRFKKRKACCLVQIKDVELIFREGKISSKKAREEVASSE